MGVDRVGQSTPDGAKSRSGGGGVRRRWLVATPGRVKGARVHVVPHGGRRPVFDGAHLPLPSKRASEEDH